MFCGCGPGPADGGDDGNRDTDTDTDTDGGTTLPTYSTPIQICINEVMTDNSGSLMVDGDWPDWIELHNPTSEEQSLDGWLVHDQSDTVQRLDATSTIPAGGFLVLYASELDLPGHLPFKLNSEGDVVTVVRPDASFIEVSVPQSATDWAFARETDCCVGECWIAELWGTPGETNVIVE